MGFKTQFKSTEREFVVQRSGGSAKTSKDSEGKSEGRKIEHRAGCHQVAAT